MVIMKVLNFGMWMLNCFVNDYYNVGMYVLYNVMKCVGKSDYVLIVCGGKMRRYYIVVNEVLWNYGLIGMNNMDG